MNFANNRLTSLRIIKLRAYFEKLIRLGVLVGQGSLGKLGGQGELGE